MRDLRNFAGLCAFHSALTSTPVHRLKDAWGQVPDKHLKIFDGFSDIFSMDDNWGNLRKLHSEAHAPAILHTGIFLQDLVAIDEVQEDRKEGKVNFQKLIKLYEKIETICMYQQAGYDLKENQYIQKVLLDDFKAQQSLDDNHLFQFSSDVKKKDAGGV